MGYKVNVSSTYFWNEAWSNFLCESYFGSSKGIDAELAPWRAKNIPDSPYIVFQSEQDATLFLLKWA